MRLIKYSDADRAIKDYWQEQIDNLPEHMDFGPFSDECEKILEHNSNILKALNGIEPIDAIPVEWLEEKMNKSSGFRHAVLSETIEEWRGKNVDND